MSRASEDRNRRLLRARDTIDRSYAKPLDVGLAGLRTFSRTLSATVGESPSAYRARVLPPPGPPGYLLLGEGARPAGERKEQFRRSGTGRGALASRPCSKDPRLTL